MDRIRLIASDMDATLLDGHSQLPPDFLHLVQELAGQDILFAAASGRPLYKLEEMFAPVLEQTLLVADNGGAVRWRGKDLFVSRMEPEVWDSLMELNGYGQEIRDLVTTIRERGDCLSLKELAVKGQDLIAAGVKPGKEMGTMLHELLEHVLKVPQDNEKETLLKLFVDLQR